MEMVKDEMMIRKFIVAASASLALAALASAQEFDFRWTLTPMDASRTGVKAASAENVSEAMGEVRGHRYHAPNGRVFRKGSVCRVAGIMLAAQPEMAEVKEVIGYSPRAMYSHNPESELSDWFVDVLMQQCSELTGRKVDVGFVNFGGIRTNMPEGDVLLDDILSMFPFRNRLCYLELKGKDIRTILERMAAGRWEVIGGVRCVSNRSGKLLSAEIGGKPIEDEKVYGVATIDFLLKSGDNLNLARNALKVEILEPYVYDVMVPYVRDLYRQGKPVEYEMDGRVRIVDK